MDYQDLIYFGNSTQGQVIMTDFINGIKDAFPAVVLSDAYDTIKGYRQEVKLDFAESQNYNAWLIAHGWGELSLNINLLMMSGHNEQELIGYVDLAKEKYPHRFKNN